MATSSAQGAEPDSTESVVPARCGMSTGKSGDAAVKWPIPWAITSAARRTTQAATRIVTATLVSVTGDPACHRSKPLTSGQKLALGANDVADGAAPRVAGAY